MTTDIPTSMNLVDGRPLLGVLRAAGQGDFSCRLPTDETGLAGELAMSFNYLLDLLQRSTDEMHRVSEVVGTEGKIGQRATLPGSTGGWAIRIESLNKLISDLVGPTAEVSRVIGAVAKGDLSQRMEPKADGVALQGEFLRLGNTVNRMVDQLGSFASEVTRVAREVGSEGKLGGQADVKGVGGTWKDLTESVNFMAANLTGQVRNIADVTTAVARGDLTRKITVDAKGEILELKNTINVMVDQLNSFASEVSRVAREVGSEGKLGGQADVKGVGGTWKDLTDNVNGMAANLTGQVRNIAYVTTAVATGDLTRKITVDAKGEILELKNTINVMVDQLNSFASEVTRVAREVGTEGKLGGQADVKGVGGTWKDLTESVNGMAANLTGQVRNIAYVTTAVATGDLTRKITVDAKGEIQKLKNTINVMVDQLNSFASEVSRVAREVGTDGKLGGQADVKGVGGTWKDLTDNVNGMAANLTGQVRNIADVTTAVANGDLTRKITADAKGEILELKNTINVMVDQLNSFASEVTRVAREVGTEGKLGGQADVKGVGGTWKDITDNVNGMAANLTGQVRNIADVTTAVANGDLSKKITADAKGEILELKNTINVMVDQLNSFASEVSRVAREVGSEGKLGGQADVKGVGGTWKDLTDNVNGMAANLTGQVRNIADVTISVANGDLSKKIAVDVRGEFLQLKDAINTMVNQLRSFASEVTRVAREVGTDGKLGGQAVVPGVAGVWKDLTESVNGMGGNLTGQVRNIAQVTTAVAKGDLTQKITVDAKGEILELKNTINVMVDQLNSFASEVTRVAREVGTDGKLGGQAQVRGVSGTWKDLTDSVNFMAGNLTDQVRGIAKVVTGVANGDLKQKLTVQAKGEIAALSETINSMIDTLATFADQVTSVAREVGVQGKLGGQADVPGAAGTWKDLTDNVNELAANLTSQVRAIAEVATAVTKGDLTRSIGVEASGEVAELKDNINQMIGNLRDTTQKNTQQDWLKTNLAKFTRLLQGQRGMVAVAKLILDELAPLVSAQHGVFYIMDKDGETATLRLLSSYAYQQRRGLSNQFAVGEGLVGQCALEKSRILITDVPSHYVRIGSGLGNGRPRNIVVIPIIFEGEVKAIIELASFNRFTDIHLTFLDQLTEGIGIVLNSISAGMRTEQLLKQSQSLADELQSQQEELKEKNTRLEQQTATLRDSEVLLTQQQDQLQKSNQELEVKARLLAGQKAEVEKKNHQIELARKALQERAEQLSLTSKYKSEFLANMSHELRTPLNSLLILSKMLGDNRERNLTEKQVEYAQAIHGSGAHLLSLISDILDMAKVESGTMGVEIAPVAIEDVRAELNRTFSQLAQEKGLAFRVQVDPRMPSIMYTDAKRLHQILNNLVSNACKFTGIGQVEVTIAPATSGWNDTVESLNRERRVVAFGVRDTGIGIPPDKCKVIFEPFQQADTGTARKYGGTGLGLSISREIAHLLGGEIRLESTLGQGSTFTLYLPDVSESPTRARPQDPSPPKQGDAFAREDRGAHPESDAREFEAGDVLHRDTGWTTAIAPDVNRIRRVLVVEDNEIERLGIATLIKDESMHVLAVGTAAEALAALTERPFDVVVLDLKLPDLPGMELLRQMSVMANFHNARVLVYTGIELKPEDEKELARLGELVIKKNTSSPALLLAEIRKCLSMPQDSAAAVEPARSTNGATGMLAGKTVLTVDDDYRNVFALAAVLEKEGVEVLSADSGQEALKLLKEVPSIDLVLMDIMMPSMDGYETMRRIRAIGRFQSLPIIALTAKVMKGDREKCLEAGASDYVPKPVDPDHLLAFLRRWV